MRNVFGYNYPAGAEHDPRAPWNQRDEEDDGLTKEEIEEAKADIALDLAKDEDVMHVEPRDRMNDE